MDGQQSIDSAIIESESLRKVLQRLGGAQVRAAEHKQLIKATSFSWFNRHRAAIVEKLGADTLSAIDDQYRALITAAGHSTLKNKYLKSLAQIKRDLGRLQAEHVLTLRHSGSPPTAITSDVAPDFSPLVSDPKMQAILKRRWDECGVCVISNAPLAATVMMGGLLEGLLLARINQFSDRTKIFNATSAPMDRKTGKTAQLKDWGLKDFINVAHELGWITRTAKDVGEVVRDYRNYIHPQKEFSHGIVLENADAKMLWEVAKSMTHQILAR